MAVLKPAPSFASSPLAGVRRRLPIGAELIGPKEASFRVWAPRRNSVDVVLQPPGGRPRTFALTSETNGYFSGQTSAEAGDRYGYRLDAGEKLFPDPIGRYQPDGPGELSQLVDPATFRWTDDNWPGVQPDGQVIYEMHIGTFTPEGTWQAAIKRLPDLKWLGITLLEVMPVADWTGRFGWGYDGVAMFAPTRLYGTPDDFRAFVDAAHALQLGVILDVVYNHFGSEHNYSGEFSANFKSESHSTDWGDALNFDDEHAGGVREFFISNARYWIREFHLDGYRFDATQSIMDASERHILGELTAAAREEAGEKTLFFASENEPQEVRGVQDQRVGGFGMTAIWNDDFHHSARVCLTGQSRAYYSDFRGAPEELIAAAKYGFIYQGQHSRWQKKPRGTSTRNQQGSQFITFLQNHDQVANSVAGERLHEMTSPGKLRAMTALWLLSPQTPLFFQGQEFAASSPFLYFADAGPDIAPLVVKGRAEFMSQFPHLATAEQQQRLARPNDPQTFERSKLKPEEWQTHKPVVRLHHDLLQMRRDDTVFQEGDVTQIDGVAIGPQALLLRYFGVEEDRLLLVNFGSDLTLTFWPHPLYAPPDDEVWEVLWGTEQAEYGGSGMPAVLNDDHWLLPAEAAVVLRSREK